MANVGNTTPEGKRQSRNRVYRFIYGQKKTCRQEIAQSLGISMPTVLQNVKELIASGLVCELGQFASMGGRKAAILAPVGQVRYALGLCFSRDYIDLVMTDLLGDIPFYRRVNRVFSKEPAYFAQLESTIARFVEDSGVDACRILGAGVALPAIFDRAGENIFTSRTLGLTAVPCQMFSCHIPYRCVFINDANATGIAEMRALGNPRQNYAYVTLSACLGGVIFIGGERYVGDTLRDAEFGHMRLHPGGKTCFCGQQGCVNSYLSASLLSDAAGGSLESFFQGVAAENPHYRKIWDTYLDDLALLVNNLRMVFDCNVILGGDLANYITPYLDELHRRLARINAFWMDIRYVQPCLQKVGAAALGAALQLIEQFIAQV